MVAPAVRFTAGCSGATPWELGLTKQRSRLSWNLGTGWDAGDICVKPSFEGLRALQHHPMLPAGGGYPRCPSPQEIPGGLEVVTESTGAELGASEAWVGVPTTRLLGLVGPAVLGVTGAGVTVGARGLLAVAIASRIQSRSLVTRA